MLLLAASSAQAATPSIDIHSAGPLSDIYIGNDLSCQVRSGAFSSTEFFPNASGPGDCGTFFNTGSDTATQELPGSRLRRTTLGALTPPFRNEVPVTPVSQSLTGAGTAASPYVVTTVVTGNDPFPSGGPPIQFQVTEVDTYVVGQNFYRTDVTIKNVGTVGQAAQGTLYHAADCQLRGSNSGFGTAEPPLGALQVGVACTLAPNADQVREQLVPITSGGSWAETTPPTLWQTLSNGSNCPADAAVARTTSITRRGSRGLSPVSPPELRRPFRSTP